MIVILVIIVVGGSVDWGLARFWVRRKVWLETVEFSGGSFGVLHYYF